MNKQEKYTQHILKFLEDRPYISLSTLERTAKIADGAIRQAKSAGRLIPKDAIYAVLCELSKCGITDIYGYKLKFDSDTNCLFGYKFDGEEKCIEVLKLKNPTETIEREVTDEMKHPDFVDPLDSRISSSSFYYTRRVVKVLYSDYLEL